MLRNYFKTAWRNVWNNKFYSGINILGLAIGLAVGIIILFWVRDELSYDGFHRNAGNLYKINSHLGTGTGAGIWEGAPAPLAVFCMNSIPEVVHAVRIENINEEFIFSYKDRKFKESNLAFVDSNFFSVFDFRLLKGNAAKPFSNIQSIVLTSSVAEKYFGKAEPVGKVLSTEQGNFTVSGVMEDFPENSSLKYDMLLPMALNAEYFTQSGGNGDWKTIDEDLGSFAYQIYIQLREGISAEPVARELTKIYQSKKGDDAKADFFSLQPLSTRHLVSADGGTGRLQTVRIFFLVGILILLIACINYVNLTMARSVLRSKEVSLRKIIGAARYQLFIQFIFESLLLFLIASLLSIVIIYLLFPLYNDLSGKRLGFNLADKNVWLVIGGAISATLTMAAVYPALILSSFKPLEALRGKLSFGIGSSSFRKLLVIVQFVFSLGLITATLVIGSQLKYLREKDLGYNKEFVFAVPLRSGLFDHFGLVRTELLKQPGIIGMASSQSSIIGSHSNTADTEWEGKKEGRMFLIQTNAIDQHFIPLLKLKLVAGNNFTGSPSDSVHYILNETAIKEAGITNPIGKPFSLWGKKGTIVGVVKDFNYASLKETIKPAIFYFNPSRTSLMYVKTTGRHAAAAIAAAERAWKTYVNDFPFEYTFLEDDYNKMYRADQRTGLLFSVFAGVAILISCLGLFGLATYTAQVKTKEIGIRKVLGASVANISRLLVKEFLILILIAFILATPITWFSMNKWLQNYAYRIHISWWIFLVTGFLGLFITFITVGFQAVKAAITNPVTSLRSE